MTEYAPPRAFNASTIRSIGRNCSSSSSRKSGSSGSCAPSSCHGGVYFGQGSPGFFLPIPPDIRPPLVAIPVYVPLTAIAVPNSLGATVS
jgi:hypothetical protein